MPAWSCRIGPVSLLGNPSLAVSGIVLGAAYMLWLYQRTMFGEITKEANKTLPDLDGREMATLIPIIVFCFWIGLYPAPFLKAMEASVANVIQTVEKGSAAKAVQPKRAAISSQPSAVVSCIFILIAES